MNSKISSINTKVLKGQGGLILVTIVLCIIFTVLNSSFFTSANYMNIVRQSAVNIIVVMGMTFLMTAGELDLSLGGVACLTGMFVSKLLISGISIPIVIVLGLCLGAMIGLVNGWLTTAFGLPSMIVTLAMNTATNGAASLITGGTAIYGLPTEFQFLGRGTIAGIPNQVIIMAVVVIISWVVFNKTLTGRYALAIGGNNQVAKLAGISVNKNKIIYFVVSGMLAALAGMIMTSRMTTGQPNLATDMTMDTITAVVIGGTSLAGGYGSIIGSLIGALLLTIIENGLTIVGIGSYWQAVITAIILVATIIARRKKD